MNSTKKIISAAIFATLFTGYANAAADNVNILITGRVIASPCTTVNGGQNPLTVSLGDDIGASSLQSAGSNSQWVEFDLALTGCPSGTNNVKATFTGSPDTVDGTRWLNTAASKALNTSVELKDKATSVTISNGSMLTAPVASNKATFRLKTAAYSAQGNAQPGDISTVILASFVYQ
ncbi:fimbrial protein [Buttiauxella agrestis]|uniref:FimG family fimbrial adaptor subunit n=1 Tax=Buttiauxella agrestis ATCC 33320 TaxID=1006004 RepID=A0A085GC71_9ENTR|nr:fimbrial protein [Buttiauxella agrestis]KFC81316.1 FimG family fimbrial adaptor subunit [Buttiauxella agrestis ATCC 33320]